MSAHQAERCALIVHCPRGVLVSALDAFGRLVGANQAESYPAFQLLAVLPAIFDAWTLGTL